MPGIRGTCSHSSKKQAGCVPTACSGSRREPSGVASGCRSDRTAREYSTGPGPRCRRRWTGRQGAGGGWRKRWRSATKRNQWKAGGQISKIIAAVMPAALQRERGGNASKGRTLLLQTSSHMGRVPCNTRAPERRLNDQVTLMSKSRGLHRNIQAVLNQAGRSIAFGGTRSSTWRCFSTVRR